MISDDKGVQQTLQYMLEYCFVILIRNWPKVGNTTQYHKTISPYFTMTSTVHRLATVWSAFSVVLIMTDSNR